MVYMHYCDGGSFGGSNDTVTKYVHKNKEYDLHFRGRHIVDGTIDDLLSN